MRFHDPLEGRLERLRNRFATIGERVQEQDRRGFQYFRAAHFRAVLPRSEGTSDGTLTWTKANSSGKINGRLERTNREVMLVPGTCATLRFSTAGVPEPASAQAVREFKFG